MQSVKRWMMWVALSVVTCFGASKAEAGISTGLRAGLGINTGRSASANLGNGSSEINPSPVYGDFNLSVLADTTPWNRSGIEVDLQVGGLNILGVYAASMIDFAPGPLTLGVIGKAGAEFLLGEGAALGLGLQAGVIGGYEIPLSRNVSFEVGGDISYRFNLLFGTTLYVGHSVTIRTYGLFRFG